MTRSLGKWLYRAEDARIIADTLLWLNEDFLLLMTIACKALSDVFLLKVNLLLVRSRSRSAYRVTPIQSGLTDTTY